MTNDRLGIAIDIDGTLLSSREELHARTEAVIYKLLAQGHMVTLATGRMVVTTLPWAKRLGITAPLVCLNGAITVDADTGASLAQHAMPVREIERLLVYLQDQAVEAILLTEHYVVTTKPRPTPAQVIQVDDLRDFVAAPVEPILKVTLRGATEDAIRGVYETLVGWDEFALSRSEGSHLSLTAKGITKLSGLIPVLARYDVPLTRLIAFGNGENDVALLQGAAEGYAMANSEAVVLAQIPLRTLSNDQCGVAHILERIAHGARESGEDSA